MVVDWWHTGSVIQRSEGLAQGPYAAARGAGFEPVTLWMKGAESTYEPPRSLFVIHCVLILCRNSAMSQVVDC